MDKEVTFSAKQVLDEIAKSKQGLADLLSSLETSLQEMQKTFAPMTRALAASAQAQERAAEKLAQAMTAEREWVLDAHGNAVGSRIKRSGH
jgi:ABC-type transporter Mla subunit MlaD